MPERSSRRHIFDPPKTISPLASTISGSLCRALLKKMLAGSNARTQAVMRAARGPGEVVHGGHDQDDAEQSRCRPA